MSAISKIRAATIGKAKNFKTKVVEVEGVEIEIREPSYKQRSTIISNSTVNGDIDSTEFLVNSIIALCYEPGTSNTVFEAGDKQSMLDMPVNGSFMDTLSTAIGEILGGDSGEAEKN